MTAMLLLVAIAGEATLHITDQVANPVHPHVYSQFLEHIYQSVHGGLDAELILDGDFEREPAASARGDGWAVDHGTWRVGDDSVSQMGDGIDTHLFWLPAGGFGERYRLSLRARKLAGAEGFLIIFGARDEANFHWWNLGGWNNQWSSVERETNGARQALGPTRTETRIETGRWYEIAVAVDGERAELFLDGERLVALDGIHAGGFVGLGTWNTRAEFADVAVTAGEVAHRLPLDDLRAGLAQQAALAPGWTAGDGAATVVVTNDPYQGERCQRLAGGSIAYGTIPVDAGRRYAGRLAVRGGGRVTARLVIDGAVAAETPALPGAVVWRERTFYLQPRQGGDAELQIHAVGSVELDSVSLRPAGDDGAPLLFRPDLLEAIRALHPPLIRWPGGYFAERYHWRDAVGPRSLRPRRADATWEHRDPNGLGTDEFIALCREVGAEPMICLNIGQHDEDALAPLRLSQALAWIEYCNGDLTTAGGRARAANGHPEPYGVKYWEVGNETWGMGIDRYLARARMFLDAISEAHPDLVLSVCGSGGHNDGWNARVIDTLAGRFTHLSVHHYGGGGNYLERMANAVAYVDFLARTRERIRASADPAMQLAVTEWNLMSTSLDSGLWAAIFLLGCERLGETVTMANPALFLRETTAPAWDNALINLGPRGWFAGGNYLAMSMFWNDFTPERLSTRLETEALGQFGETRLDAVYALAGRDGDRLVVKAVNLTPDQPVLLRLQPAMRVSPRAEHHSLTGETPETRNSLDQPDRLRIETRPLTLDPAAPAVELPPHSVNVIVLWTGEEP